MIDQPRDSGRWPAGAERPEDLIKVAGDAHFVIEEVIQPGEVLAVRRCNEGKKLAKADGDIGSQGGWGVGLRG